MQHTGPSEYKQNLSQVKPTALFAETRKSCHCWGETPALDSAAGSSAGKVGDWMPSSELHRIVQMTTMVVVESTTTAKREEGGGVRRGKND